MPCSTAKTLKLSVSVGTYLNPWWFLLRDPEGLKAFLPYSSPSPKDVERTGDGEQEPWLPAVLIVPLGKTLSNSGPQIPHLFPGRKEFLLGLLFCEIDFGPLEASERIS